MAALNFPSSPTVGQVYTANGLSYTWDGVSWDTLAGTLAIAGGGTGQTTATAAFNALAPTQSGNSGKYLTTDGTNTSWGTVSSGGFDAGTRMIFAQTSAPTGWTKDTTNYNNHALRVVTGSASTGGSVDFTTAFASQAVTGSVGTSGATTLSTTQMPSHTHGLSGQRAGGGGVVLIIDGGNSEGQSATTNSTGGGGSHTHSGGTFTGTAINLAVKYLDVITATKN